MIKKPKGTKAEMEHEIETTGHEWDGIRELNNPLPRWWLWTFYLTIVWGLVYMVIFPAIPLINKATPGIIGYDSRAVLKHNINHYKQANAPLDRALITTPLEAIGENEELLHYARTGGAALYRTYCSQCHGAGAAGAKGYPNLLDDDWLWGGSLQSVYLTIRHGVRAPEDDDTRASDMPAFAELLETDQLIDVTHYVLALSGQPHNPSLTSSGQRVYTENCADCHGKEGGGDRELGAPNLGDAIWLYGGDRTNILATITNGRQGMMPAWQTRLSEAQLRQVTLYVHQLGGGEK